MLIISIDIILAILLYITSIASYIFIHLPLISARSHNFNPSIIIGILQLSSRVSLFQFKIVYTKNFMQLSFIFKLVYIYVMH